MTSALHQLVRSQNCCCVSTSPLVTISHTRHDIPNSSRYSQSPWIDTSSESTRNCPYNNDNETLSNNEAVSNKSDHRLNLYHVTRVREQIRGDCRDNLFVGSSTFAIDWLTTLDTILGT
eukprot:GHVS01078065.1.p1 GENE.GHVS01078065.1~~GHVS01078065.1.p1  ORF type:complete len:119 (-),score=4.60 GHVS01078065.1:473-829(-)